MALFIGALLAVVIVVVAGDCKPKYDLTQSAFTAKMTRSINASPTKNTRIVFDSLLTNIGNDYNAENGKFTTRIAGTYVFTLTLMSKYSSRSTAFGCLHKNGKEQFCVWSNGNNAHETSSNTITINLKKGDVVDNVLKAGKNYALHNYGQAGYCSFTGFLLYPEVSVLENLLKTIDTLSK
ncbi:complement C1q tumor necrosis factor-related protein 4-like [Anneissia japonica]|uniref:complement C1q tumor necrosis factor-related protein 4-like n=1 Tax=Anneissia japonica TaxID=1529436 RepID=UPI001425BB11|nr:complement C1q tumor necrosis factor-related protein 4-like [Anneissia japonica]